MNEELVEKRLNDMEKRLTDIETKIDKLTELVSQTALQEYRLKIVEDDIKTMKCSIDKLQKSPGDIALKWLGIIGGGIVTILLGFIAVKLGLK